jgi:invasion protein IalB
MSNNKFSSKYIAVITLVIVAGLGIATATRSNVFAGNKDGKKFDNWLVKCAKDEKNKKEECMLLQEALVDDEKEKTKKRLLAVAIGKVGEKKELAAIFDLPFNLYLPKGIPVGVDDGEKITMQVETCLPTGCKAGLKINDDLLKSMRNGKSLIVSIVQADSLQGYDISLPLKGIKEGIELID